MSFIDSSATVFPLRWIGTMILFTYHSGRFDCNGRGFLHSYLVGLLVILALIILSLCAIVQVSAKGRAAMVNGLSRLLKTKKSLIY